MQRGISGSGIRGNFLSSVSDTFAIPADMAGWIAAVLFGLLIQRRLIHISGEQIHFFHRLFAFVTLAEFFWTAAKAIALVDRRLPDCFRLSAALRRIGDILNWACLMKRDERLRGAALVERYGLASDLFYAECATLVVFCALLAMSARPGAAALGVWLVVSGVIGLSDLKFDYVQSNLHAYDFVYYANRKNAAFFFAASRSVATGAVAALVCGVALFALIVFIEPVAVGRGAALGVFLAAALAFAGWHRYSATFAGWQDYWKFYDRKKNVAVFVRSIFDAIGAWRRGGVLAISPAPPEVQATEQQVPAAPSSPPDIIMILNESVFPPWLYRPELRDADLEEFFTSADGRRHGMRVETFGGATWMTEFSVLTGIPTSCYGSFRSHVFHWAAGKIHESLPLRLKEFGFTSATIYPVDGAFIDSERFLKSIGMDDMRDKTALGAGSDAEPDSFYFDAGLDWLEGHAASGGGPAFLYMVTMWNHFPHDVQGVDAEGLIRTTKIVDCEFDEYMRRLRRSCADYAKFRADLARRFPDRRFLIVRMGDHQPPFAAQLVPPSVGPEQARDLLHQTFFAIDSVNFDPHIDPALPDTIEAAYLGGVGLDAAGVPRDELAAARAALMAKHDGKFYFADDGRSASQLNRRMIEAGLVEPH